MTSFEGAQVRAGTSLGVRREPRGSGEAVLVGPEWLAEHLSDPSVRVVEVDVNRVGFDDWHIEGAVLWEVYGDLKDANFATLEPPAFERLIRRSGIDEDATVVLYGYAPALGFWLLKLYGHRDVRILDCARDAWRAGGFPWSTSSSDPPAETRYRLGEPSDGLRAGAAAVRAAIADPAWVIVDVRSEDEYRGGRFWPSGGLEPNGRAGHVPSAIHQPIDGIYDERGAFRSASELRRMFASLELEGGQGLITYCTIGGRASTAWFVLTQLLGRDGVRVYDGSWAEWGRMGDAPVEGSFPTSGEDPGAVQLATEHQATNDKEMPMPGLVRKSLDAPEEVRRFEGDTGQLALVNLDAGPVGRATFLPGWRWSSHVKPIAKTDSCQAAHSCYFVSGRMAVVMDDGEQIEYGPGDFAIMAPRHDAWIVGDEPCVVVDWQGFADYAKP